MASGGAGAVAGAWRGCFSTWAGCVRFGVTGTAQRHCLMLLGSKNIPSPIAGNVLGKLS